ncbi:DUF1553 domain-containing protein [Haloferula sp. A504]|uniref:DUF1553 domain-containing protein n=1 Tax=Haloferula sp. A504 TaxID=3373601 RepID=UPI0031C45489|nr:DUF1553 domain-containing protein [Verrucomicrobiaceae bacterium E54]
MKLLKSFLTLTALGVIALNLMQCREKPIATFEGPATDEATAGAPSTAPDLPKEITFNEHIQPILSEYCYHCHGPDAGTRMPESEPLRLDLAEDALKPREGGKPVIIPGDPEASLLVKLLHSDDPETIMPPPESHKELDARQIALLERWIADGAEYQDHWSFLAVENPEVPDGEWGRSPIDKFIGSRMQEAGLAPNPEQAPARFHRRLHFDLTGLPPAPETTARFLKNYQEKGDEALSAEIDRLLDTTAAAEHLARHWLDNARYADTHGIHIDNYRAIWPYRDWVIRAFKQNMPWDQFTIEQIAGDMLPDATLDQIVATGFHRCLPTTGEGGAIAEEYEAIYAQDRTDTTSAVWLGLTVGCASCHDHKFDPISMKDTYAFNAFFRNTTMGAMDRNDANHPPNIFVPLPEDRARYAELNDEISKLDTALASRSKAAKPLFEEWVTSPAMEDPRDIDSTLALYLPLNDAEGPIKGYSEGKTYEWPVEVERIDGPLGKAPVVSRQPIELGDHASFARGDQVTFGGYIYLEGNPNGAVISRMGPGPDFRGWDLFLEGDKPAVHIIDEWPHAANKMRRGRGIGTKSWQHVMVTFDGRQAGHQALALYVNGDRARMGSDPNTVGGNIVSDAPLILGSRSGGDSKLTGGKVALQDFRLYRRLLTPDEIKRLSGLGQIAGIIGTPRDQWNDDQSNKVFEYFLNYVDQPSIDLRAKKAPLDKELADIRHRGSISLVMEEKKGSEPFAHILNRGVYSDKGEKVAADTPASLPPMAGDLPKNRLGLAKWLVSRDNPLTARVTMNRLWAQLFGRGIVETVGDFGIMGARPTHPKLLDWLAYEFMDSGWDYRHMIKQIAMSDTYRQSAVVSSEKLEADPSNEWLSRGPRYRLDAEQLRDLALAASDLLSPKVGGPPVKPYQPEGIWSAVAMPQSNTRNYQQDSGESLYRRSIYTFWKRTAPHPAMEILNAPTREVTCVAREMTNTPLQAFVTLNDPQFVEAARNLAQRALAHGDFDDRLDFISQRLISRLLDDDERRMARQTLEAAFAEYLEKPDAAEQLLGVGESKPEPGTPAPELAAWTIVASQILNLDETLTK